MFTDARTGLSAGTQLYYRGFATNSAGTSYSPDGSFYTEPATQASAVNFTGVTANSMTVNWTRGSGSEVIVLMHAGAAVDSDPVDGTYTGYTANTAFGSGTQIGTGNYVVYKGTGSSATITGLSGSTTYDVAVYEMSGAADTSGTAQGTNYLLTPATGSQATGAGASAPTVTTPTATSLAATTATLGADITADGGASITDYGTCWGTTAAPTTNCSSLGAGATGVFTDARTGLTAGTQLYYRGFATNSAGTGYSTDGSFYTEPATQASAVNFTGVTGTSMTVNWTRGSGSGVIVLIHSGAAVDSDPVDGTYTGYTANTAFGSGTQIGTGNYVVYKGAGTGVTVTGLSASTTYDVAVYEMSGAADTSGAAQGTNYLLTPATGSQATGAACSPAPPTVTIAPASQTIPNDGGLVVYTVTIVNNDSATCGPTTFLLSTGDSNSTAFYSSILDKADTGALASNGGTTTASLTVQVIPGNDAVSDNTTVTATDSPTHDPAVPSSPVTTSVSLGGGCVSGGSNTNASAGGTFISGR